MSSILCFKHWYAMVAKTLAFKPAVLSTGFRSVPSAAAMACKRAASTVARERPLSPHLEIYKFRVNMITSVFFRGTGMALVGGLTLGSIAYLFTGTKYPAFVYSLQQHPLFNAIVKFGVVFPLTYHYLGGLRHLAWDNIIGQNMKFVKQTGWGATAIAGAAGVVAMFTTFSREEK